MQIDELAEDVSALTTHLYNASIEMCGVRFHRMDGLGGCEYFDITGFPEKYQKYIQNYIDNKRDSSQCIIDYLYDNHYLYSGAKSI